MPHQELRIGPAGETHGDDRVCEKGREDLVLVPKVLVIRKGTKQQAGAARIEGVDRNQTGRVGYR